MMMDISFRSQFVPVMEYEVVILNGSSCYFLAADLQTRQQILPVFGVMRIL